MRANSPSGWMGKITTLALNCCTAFVNFTNALFLLLSKDKEATQAKIVAVFSFCKTRCFAWDGFSFDIQRLKVKTISGKTPCLEKRNLSVYLYKDMNIIDQLSLFLFIKWGFYTGIQEENNLNMCLWKEKHIFEGRKLISQLNTTDSVWSLLCHTSIGPFTAQSSVFTR